MSCEKTHEKDYAWLTVVVLSHGRRVAGVDEVLGVDGEGIDRREVRPGLAQPGSTCHLGNIFRLLGSSQIPGPVQTFSSNRKCSFSRYLSSIECSEGTILQLCNFLSAGLPGQGGAGVLDLLSDLGDQRGQEEPRHGRPAQRRPHCQLHHRRLCGLPLHGGRELFHPTSLPGPPEPRRAGDFAGHAAQS